MFGCTALSLQQAVVHHGVCVIMEATYLEAVWQQRIRLSPGFPISPPCLPTSDLSPPVWAYLPIRPLLSVPSNHESLKWITLDEGRTPRSHYFPKASALNTMHLGQSHLRVTHIYSNQLCVPLLTSCNFNCIRGWLKQLGVSCLFCQAIEEVCYFQK